jgi:hypothetical protein
VFPGNDGLTPQTSINLRDVSRIAWRGEAVEAAGHTANYDVASRLCNLRGCHQRLHRVEDRDWDQLWVVFELRDRLRHMDASLDDWPPVRIDTVIAAGRHRLRQRRLRYGVQMTVLLILAAAGGFCLGLALH